MRIVDFKKLDIEITHEYQIEEISLNLMQFLDTPFAFFVDTLQEQMNRKFPTLDAAEDVCFKIYTDLNRRDAISLSDFIANSVATCLFINKNEYKHQEKRLGIPATIEKANMGIVNLMDLINFPLIVERFNIEIYDRKNRLVFILVK